MRNLPPPLPQSYVCLPLDILLQPRYSNLSPEAKLLYAVLLNRAQLSARNQWYNADGDCYVYYTLNEIQNLLGCKHGKATNTLRELERHHLIRRKAQGQGKPHQIIILPYCSTANAVQSSLQKIGRQRSPFPATSKNDSKKTNDQYTIARKMQEMKCVDGSLDDLPADKLDAIFDVLADIICNSSDSITIGKHTIRYDDMRDYIWSLDAQQIRCLYYDWICRHSAEKNPHDCVLAYLANTI